MTDGSEEILVVTRHDPALEDDVDFVNYTPSNLLNRQHRKTVNSFVSSVKKRRSRQPNQGQVRHVAGGKAAMETSGRTPAHSVQPPFPRRAGRGPQPRDWGYFIGGLRTDPFKSYPVPARDPVTSAVDIYCQIWAPTHIGQYFPDDGSNFLLSELFPLALQQRGLFEALVAWSQCFSSTYYKQDTFLTKEVLYHRGNALAELRASLTPSSRFSNDAAVVTLLFLMGVDYLTGDVTTSETLLQGIYQVVDHAGGLDKLGLKGLTKAMILRIEKEWTRRRNQKSRYTDVKPTECLEYPTHPFRPDLCNSIATMPKGFRDLALDTILSIQMLQILERMSEWHTRAGRVHQHGATAEDLSFLQAHQPQVEAEEAYRSLEILMSSGAARGIERCLFYGLIGYCLEAFAQKKFNTELYWIIQDLPMALDQIEPEAIEMECLIWVSMVAVVTCKGSLSQKGREIMDKLLRDHPRLKEWHSMEETLRKFFWVEALAGQWKKCWSTALMRQALTRESSTESGTPPEGIHPDQLKLPQLKGKSRPSL